MEQQQIQDDQNEISLKEIIRIVLNRKWWLILTFFLVVSGVVGYLYQATPVYSSSATLWIEPSQSGSSFEDLFAIQAGGTSTKIATEVEIIKSRRNLVKIIEELDLIKRYSRKYEYKSPLTVDRLVNQLSGAISVSTVKDTNIVKITVEHDDYLLARDIANTLAVVYNNLLKDLAQNDFSIRKEFIESQIGPAAANVVAAEDALREFKENNGIFLLDEEARVLLENITSYEQSIDPYIIQRDEAVNKQEAFSQAIIEDGGKVLSYELITSDREIKSLTSELTNARIELFGYGDGAAASSRATELRTRAMRLENELKALISDAIITYGGDSVTSYQRAYYLQLSNAYTQQLLAEINITYLNQLKAGYVEKMDSLPVLEQKLLDLQRDVTVKENLYLLLLQNYEEAKIAEAAVSGTSTIIDEAIANPIPIKPNKQMMLAIGVLLGLFLGVLLVFLIEAFDDSVKDEDSIKRALGLSLPILGRIPHLYFDSDEPLDELVVYNDPTSPAAESYKMIATNVLYSSVQAPKVITVCSSEMAAGKTSVSANTGIAMAQNGLRTLMIDADMRKPRIEKAFGLQRATDGLVNHLLQNIELKSLILKPLDELPNLHLLPVGPLPPNPTSLIASEKFRNMLSELRQWYDRIIIDLPPLLAASDGLIVTRSADGMIVVIRMGNTSKHGLHLAGENVSNSEIPLLGMVINDITKENSYNYYHYYYYYNMGGEKVYKKRKFKNRYGSYGSRYRYGSKRYGGKYGSSRKVNNETEKKDLDQMKVNPKQINESEKKVRANPDSVLTKSTEDFLKELELSEGEKTGPDEKKD